MTNTVLLEARIAESGMMKKAIAQKLGLSAYGFAKKVSGQSDFKTEEVRVLCSLLGITSLKEKEDIFFAEKVD